MISLEQTFADFGIDPRAVDEHQIDEWQRTPTSDKPRRRNGAVMFKPDGAVVIQNWATGEKTVWQPEKGSAAYSISRRRAFVSEARRTEKQKLRGQLEAATTASAIWERSNAPSDCHPYLEAKGLPPLELRETDCINGWKDRWLIAPLYSGEPLERICNLECINSNGEKRPIKGALRSNVFGFAGPGIPTDTVVICEGWATAAALHDSLGIPVVFTVGASNLPAVAKGWRKRLPNADIVIAADDDPKGLAHAEQAAKQAHAWIRRPIFDNSGGDWCDVYSDWGPDLVRQGWNHGT